MMRKKRSGMPMGRAWLWLLISLLLTIGLILPGNTVGADDPIPTPTSASKQPARIEVLSSLQMVPSSEFDSQGPYIYLTNYTFDPLSEATPHSLPADLTLSSYPRTMPRRQPSKPWTRCAGWAFTNRATASRHR
jgi:hypothetical protein